MLHAAATTAAAVIISAWAQLALGDEWALVALVIAEAVIAYGLAWLWIARNLEGVAASVGALAALFIGELTLIAVSSVANPPPLAVITLSHVVNLSLILWLSWKRQWQWIGIAAVLPAWLATAVWYDGHRDPMYWSQVLMLATALYAVFAIYPFVLGSRARESRDPYLTAIVGSVFYFFAARSALLQGGLSSIVGVVPVFEGGVLALLLRALLRIEPKGGRDLARLAIVAGSALAFATVAIPLQLKQQWITIGWALEGAALAWLYRRIPHRGLFYSAMALLSAVFVRLALNPAIFIYEPRGMRVFNWYLYAYLTCSVTIFVAAWWLSRTDDRLIVARRLGEGIDVAPAGWRDPAVPSAQHRDRGLLRHRSGDHVQVRREHRPGFDLHPWMADLRAGPAGRRDLSAQSAGPYDGGRADCDHDVQGVPLRHGIARGPGAGGIVCRPRHLALARRSWRCRSSCCRHRRKTHDDESQWRRSVS